MVTHFPGCFLITLTGAFYKEKLNFFWIYMHMWIWEMTFSVDREAAHETKDDTLTFKKTQS